MSTIGTPIPPQQQTVEDSNMSRIKKAVTTLIIIYIILAIINGLDFTLSTLRDGSNINALLSCIVFALIAVGLYYRRPATVMIMPIIAALGTISSMVAGGSLLATIIFVFFYGFQIYFFTRKDVKAYFQVKGTALL